VIETVGTKQTGVDELRSALDEHQQYLTDSGEREDRRRKRAATEIRRLLRTDLGELGEQLLDSQGGVEALAAAVARKETDPYAVVERIVDPLDSAIEQSAATRATGTNETELSEE